jgi:hypothetical protein
MQIKIKTKAARRGVFSLPGGFGLMMQKACLPCFHFLNQYLYCRGKPVTRAGVFHPAAVW